MCTFPREFLIQCVYLSYWLPCEFCRAGNIGVPCVKLRSPKSRQPVSGLIPTADTSVIAAEDVLLLEYAYSSKKSQITRTALFRIVASQYGATISSPPLRQAILAFSACLLPQSQFRDRVDLHKQQATHLLLRKVKNRDISDAEVLASCLLAIVATFTNSPVFEVLAHSNGCLSMLPLTPSTTFLTIFAPYLSECAIFYDSIGSLRDVISYRLSTHQRATLRQRIRYYETLRPFGSPPEAWQLSSSIKATNEILEDIINILRACICRVALKQTTGDYSRDPNVEATLVGIAAELDDPEFKKAIASLKPNNSLEVHVAAFQFLYLKCIDIGMTIIRSPSLLRGIVDSETIAVEWVSSYRAEMPHKGPFQDYYANASCILLAGLALPTVMESKFHRFTADEARSWVYNELCTRGSSTKAMVLRDFWERPTAKAMFSMFKAECWQSSQ